MVVDVYAVEISVGSKVFTSISIQLKGKTKWADAKSYNIQSPKVNLSWKVRYTSKVKRNRYFMNAEYRLTLDRIFRRNHSVYTCTGLKCGTLHIGRSLNQRNTFCQLNMIYPQIWMLIYFSWTSQNEFKFIITHV